MKHIHTMNGTPDTRKERGRQFSLLERWLQSCGKAKKAYNKETQSSLEGALAGRQDDKTENNSDDEIINGLIFFTGRRMIERVVYRWKDQVKD